jgi:hypothetical protein
VTIAEDGLGILLVLGLLTRLSALLAGDARAGIRRCNDVRIRSPRAAELLGLCVLGSVVPTRLAAARQAEHRQVS